MASIIKAGELERSNLAPQKAAYHLDDMTLQSEGYLDQIRKEASKIITEAQQQAQTIENEAKAKGREQAKAEARAEMSAEIEKRWGSLMPALEKGVDQARLQWMNHWEQNLIQMSLQIAARIIRREVKNEPEISLDWIREALELASSQGEITLYLHPDDHASLGDRIENLAGQIGHLGPTQILANANITKGGCKVVSQFGEIDQQIESQLARFEEELSTEK